MVATGKHPMIEILTPDQVDRARATGAPVGDILPALKETGDA